jgi:hypothetical protein
LLADLRLTNRLGISNGRLSIIATKLLFFAPRAKAELNVNTAELHNVKSNAVTIYSQKCGILCGNQKDIRAVRINKKKAFTKNWYSILDTIIALLSTRNL